MALFLLVAAALLGVATWRALSPLPATLPPGAAAPAQVFVARDGEALNDSRKGRFNQSETRPLWQLPRLLRRAFIVSEDKRYRQHGGVDWPARFAALWDNLRAGHVVRGASTIGEQAARILHPRPRTYWSHWIAGFDADRLLHRFGHERVLDFYLNQVPYGGQRRGVVPAARYYFGRDPGVLNGAEQLALAVLVRSPARYDPRAHPRALRRAVDQLAQRMRAAGAIDGGQYAAIRRAPIVPGQAPLAVDAGPFVVYARRRAHSLGLADHRLRTTLDPTLEAFVQQTLRARLVALASSGAENAAALVVDNASGDVLAWAVAPAGGAFDLDPVVIPRQPGSTLKPFVYALAMTRLGWRPDTVIEDTPLAESVGAGVHRYRNYSGRHYGPVSLRYALANSLNVPAIKTAQAVGVAPILNTLRALGFSNLRQNADYYGPAVALGDGAVSLFDLVQGYATLARRGRFLPLRVLAGAPRPAPRAVIAPAASSLIADILSDPDARAAEFGLHSVLDLPQATAVKTGTSSDYRDSWTMGFDNRYTVGVWIGRLAGGSMNRITGSSGPAPVLRQIFAHLRVDAPYAGLWRSPKLVRFNACERIGPPPCIRRGDWRLPGRARSPRPAATVAIARPVAGETLAIDPRVARQAQRYTFRLAVSARRVERVTWRLDGRQIAVTRKPQTVWQLAPGAYRLAARVVLAGRVQPLAVAPVRFTVLAAGRQLAARLASATASRHSETAR